MMCMEVQHEDEDKELVVYGDQGITTDEYAEIYPGIVIGIVEGTGLNAMMI